MEKVGNFNNVKTIVTYQSSIQKKPLAGVYSETVRSGQRYGVAQYRPQGAFLYGSRKMDTEAETHEKLHTILRYLIPARRLTIIDDLVKLSLSLDILTDHPAEVPETMALFIRDNAGKMDQEIFGRFIMAYLKIATKLKISGEIERDFLREVKGNMFLEIESEHLEEVNSKAYNLC